MYHADILNHAADEPQTLAGVQARIAALASGLDARFVEAGGALASAYQIIEKLVGSLEGVTGALDREAADAAIENMRSTADRLNRLPEMQQRRRDALKSVHGAGATLRTHIATIDKTLSFLRICGFNIKVASAGAEEFAEFAENMFGKIDMGEQQLASFERELGQLIDRLAVMDGAERQLEKECARVVPEVPSRLAEDALALQQHQQDLTALASDIAEAGRQIRMRLGTALGALQIGDITRQRLEHVAAGIVSLGDWLDANGDAEPAVLAGVRSRMLALLAAQADAAIEEFLREARLLNQTLRGIGPDAGQLLTLKDQRTGQGGGDGHSVLATLEQGIAEVARVTSQLARADEHSEQLSDATSQTIEQLSGRLRHVQKMQSDVEQMAWNTDLRCARMGTEGLALAMVAREIRGFATGLKQVSGEIAETFDRLLAATGDIRGDVEGPSVDVGQALADSLACIRSGSARMSQSLSGLDSDAATIIDILRRTTEQVDCEAEIGEGLVRSAAQLQSLAQDDAELTDSAVEPLSTLLEAMRRSYTMASEREIHKKFSLEQDAAETASNAEDDGLFGAVDDDEDDGLF